MKSIVSYDKEVFMGYITLQKEDPPIIVETEDLNEHSLIMIDITEKNSILGIELAGNDAEKLENLMDQQKIFRKENDVYVLCLAENEKVRSKTTKLGIDFLFNDSKGKNLIGIQIKDMNKYSSEFLDRYTAQ